MGCRGTISMDITNRWADKQKEKGNKFPAILAVNK